MPFTTADVGKHTKKATTDKLKRQWVEIANSVLEDCIEAGGDDESCAPKAIKQANGVIAKAIQEASEAGKGYGAKKGEQIKGKLWRGGGGKFTSGPTGEELQDIGIEKTDSDALIALLGDKDISTEAIERLRGLGLVTDIGNLSKMGKALAQALKDKDTDEAKRLMDIVKQKIAKKKGKGGKGKKPKATLEQIKSALADAGLSNALSTELINWKGGAGVSSSRLKQLERLGLIVADEKGKYTTTANARELIRAAKKGDIEAAVAAFKAAQGAKQEEASMDVGQIAKSAIEVALAVLNDSGEITQERAVKLLHALEADLAEAAQPSDYSGKSIGEIALETDFVLVPEGEFTAITLFEALTKKMSGRTHVKGDFLVVEDPEKTTTWHLPVKVNGKPNHRLMGAAKAALTSPGGHRGDRYQGPNKAEAIRKLKALYKSEGMEWTTSEAAVDDPIVGDADKLRALLQEALELLPSDNGGEPELEEEIAEAELCESATVTVVDLKEHDDGEKPEPLKLHIAVIEPGFGNQRDNHFYPADMLRRDANVFEGAKMYATDHREEEKSVRTEVSQILRCPVGFTATGAPVAEVGVFDESFAQNIRNRAALGTLPDLNCSILATGRVKRGEVEGKKANVVEAITAARSVDWVTSAGAGGHALNLAELGDDGGEQMLDQEQVKAILAESELSDELKEKLAGEEYESEDAVREAILKEAEDGGEPGEGDDALSEAEVEQALAETKLPTAFKNALGAVEYESDEQLRDAIAQATKEVKKMTGSGRPFAQGQSTAPQKRLSEEEVQKAMDDIDRRHGLMVLTEV